MARSSHKLMKGFNRSVGKVRKPARSPKAPAVRNPSNTIFDKRRRDRSAMKYNGGAPRKT